MLLLTLKQFDFGTNADGKRVVGENSPPVTSTLVTILFGTAFLFFTEYLVNLFLTNYQNLHPLLENEVNRGILARHLGVDVLGCSIVAYLGIKCRHLCSDVLDNLFKRKPVPKGTYDQRIYTYHPEAQQILTIFTTYQVKNTYDTIYWGDGIEFVIHHVLALAASWGGMYPGCAHVHAIFFFGISEFSTTILCLLANFDDEYGVVGLGYAFPLLKVAVGIVFVVGFIVCRTILWPLFSYHFVRDTTNAAQIGGPLAEKRMIWFKIFNVALSGLSVLQVLWLGQIFIIAQEEIGKVL